MATTGSGGREVQLPSSHDGCHLYHEAIKPSINFTKDYSAPAFVLRGPGYNSDLNAAASTSTYCDRISGTILWGIKVSSTVQQSISLGRDPSGPEGYSDSYSERYICCYKSSHPTFYGNYWAHYNAHMYSPDGPYWVSYGGGTGQWYITQKSVKSVFYYYNVNNPESYCPPGTTYNPQTGSCDELNSWEWDDDLNKYIPTLCLEVNGPTEITSEGFYTYTVGFDERWENNHEELIHKDTVVTLSYLGGTAENNVDFYAPVTVVIPKNSQYIEFEIEYRMLSANLNLIITPISEEYEVCLDGELEVELFQSRYYQYDDRRYTTCCKYYSLHYRDWSSCRQIAVPQYPKMTLENGKVYREGEF